MRKKMLIEGPVLWCAFPPARLPACPVLIPGVPCVMKHHARSMTRRTARRKERQVEEWQRVPQTRRERVARLAPVYQAASRARKQLLLDEVVKKTGYARKSAIRLLNHPPEQPHVIRRPHAPCYGPEVQRALF